MIGHDLDRDDIRTFRVSRIRSDIRFATRRERDFRLPPEFDVENYRGRADWQFGDIVGSATIEVAPDTAWWVERAYGGERNSVDGDVFTTEYASSHLLARWILRQDGRAIPLEPSELRRLSVERRPGRAHRARGRPSHPRGIRAGGRGRERRRALRRAGRARALRRAAVAARLPADRVRREPRGHDPGERARRSASRSRPTSSRSISRCSTSSTSAAAATRSTPSCRATRCTSTRSSSATRSAGRRG